MKQTIPTHFDKHQFIEWNIACYLANAIFVQSVVFALLVILFQSSFIRIVFICEIIQIPQPITSHAIDIFYILLATSCIIMIKSTFFLWFYRLAWENNTQTLLLIVFSWIGRWGVCLCIGACLALRWYRYGWPIVCKHSFNMETISQAHSVGSMARVVTIERMIVEYPLQVIWFTKVFSIVFC